jgi:hypothetical protein
MIDRKKTQHLYQEEGLSVRQRRSRKRAIGTRAPAPRSLGCSPRVRNQSLPGAARLEILRALHFHASR